MNYLLIFVMILQFPLFVLDMLKLFYVGSLGLVIALLSKDKDVKKYILNNLLAIDQSVNAESGGSQNETCSSRLGRYKNTVWAAKIICKLLDVFDKDHCTKYIVSKENQEGAVIS